MTVPSSPGRAIGRLYLRLGSNGDGAPAIGSLCTVTYRWETGRNLGIPGQRGEIVLVADAMDCGERTTPAG